RAYLPCRIGREIVEPREGQAVGSIGMAHAQCQLAATTDRRDPSLAAVVDQHRPTTAAFGLELNLALHHALPLDADGCSRIVDEVQHVATARHLSQPRGRDREADGAVL